MDARGQLRRIMPTREQVELFLGKVKREDGYNANNGYIYDRELGWVFTDTVIEHDGIEKSHAYYHYEKSGARRRLNSPKDVARIHTYGDSMTLCGQVNDGETWQEYLAAHFQEPVENFGVSGYSVYQAYRRMMKVEAKHPAKYIILNIYDDDHYRSLDCWRGLRFGSTGGGNTFTLPHVRVNIEKNELTERNNPCPSVKSLYKLTDEEWVVKKFGKDPILTYFLAIFNAGAGGVVEAKDIPIAFGLSAAGGAGNEVIEEIKRAHTKAALFSSRKIMELVEKFITETGRKLMVVLSHRGSNLKTYLEEGKAWDQELLDFMKTRAYPVVDLRDFHKAEFATMKVDAETYVKRYYIGHYNPAGNFFCAMSMRDAMVKWLDPRPKPYR